MSVLLARVAARRWWIFASICVFTTIFGVVAFTMTPIYRVTMVLAPATQDRGAGAFGSMGGSLGGLASAAGLSLGPRDAETEEALAVLQSREFTEKFITDKDLLPKLFPKKWDAARQAWKVPPDKQPTPAKGDKVFSKQIRTVSEDSKTGLITLQIDWRDRIEAAEWANELVRRLNEEMRARAISKANASMNFLNKELQAATNTEVQSAVSRIIESTVKQRMVANVTLDYSFRVVDRAIAPDKDDIFKPQKPLLLSVGALLGLIVGIAPIFLFGARSGPI